MRQWLSTPLCWPVGAERSLANCQAIRPTLTTAQPPANVKTTATCNSTLKVPSFCLGNQTALPVPPERQHIMLELAAPWVAVPEGPAESRFDGYPDQSIEVWHKTRGLWNRVLRARAEGKEIRIEDAVQEAAEKFNKSDVTVRRAWRRFNQNEKNRTSERS